MVHAELVEDATTSPDRREADDALPGDPAILRQLRSRSRRALRLAVGLMVFGSMTAGSAFVWWTEIGRVWRGESRVDGTPLYEPGAEVPDAGILLDRFFDAVTGAEARQTILVDAPETLYRF